MNPPETTVAVQHQVNTAARTSLPKEGGAKLAINLLLLAVEPKPLPKWMKYYRFMSYTAYSLISCYSWVYLIYVGVWQANPRLQIRYVAAVGFLEFNSYSILSPLLCPVFMGMLAYQVWKRVELDDGDFFGMLGVLLFFALINVHDGYGVHKLIRANMKDYDNETRNVIDPPPRDPMSRNEFHWQYSWSTRPTCAKKYVRDLIYQHEYDRTHLKKQILVEFMTAQSRHQQLVAARTATSHMDCYLYHDSPKRAKIRTWMRNLQNEFRCCGPYGYKMWQMWFREKELTGCDEDWIDEVSGDIPGCYDPLTRWANHIFFTTCLIMYGQAVLYIVSMVFACIHYAAMKYEHDAVGKTYSLLDMSEIDDMIKVEEGEGEAKDKAALATDKSGKGKV